MYVSGIYLAMCRLGGRSKRKGRGRRRLAECIDCIGIGLDFMACSLFIEVIVKCCSKDFSIY